MNGKLHARVVIEDGGEHGRGMLYIAVIHVDGDIVSHDNRVFQRF